MANTVKCPSCGASYRIQEATPARRARCKQCGQTFALSLASEQTVAPTVEPDVKAEGAPAAEPAEKGHPRKIGHYVVRRKLGEGAMGQVFLAHDPTLQRDVALKVLPPEFATDKGRLDRFLREARSAAQLDHPNTVAVHEAGADGNRVFIAMQLVDGGSLDEVLESQGALPWREATRVIRDAAAGLAAAHEIGLVHRDVKPANLMRTSKGVTKVVDFGLARAMAAGTRVTQPGTILGTPAYMAPEQWMGKEADARSDLYSLTCTYYHLLTGCVPFDAPQVAALGYQHRYEPFPDARQHVPDLPDAVVQILAKGSEKEPEKRYSSATELLGELDAILGTSDEMLVLQSLEREIEHPPGSEASAPKSPDSTGRLGAGWTAAARSPIGRWRRSGQSRRDLRRMLLQPRWLAAAAGVLLTVLAAVVYVNTGEGTVKIELSDPNASVEVTIDGNQIDVAGLDEPLHLSVGEHELEVTSGGFQTVTQHFSIRRGTEETLRVTLEPKPVSGIARSEGGSAAPTTAAAKAQVGQTTQPATSPGVGLGQAPPSQPGSTAPVSADRSSIARGTPPPLAVAPFDAAAARQHQEAWARHVGLPVEVTNSIGMKLVVIPAGEFDMGTPPEEAEAIAKKVKEAGRHSWDSDWIRKESPRHRVRLTKPFLLGAHEVTVAQFRQFVEETKYETDVEKGTGGNGRARANAIVEFNAKFNWRNLGVLPQGDNYSVVNVSWNDGAAFCRWLSQKENAGYRLPSEAEWEHACRAGTTTAYHFGDAPSGLDEFAWYGDNSGWNPHPAGEKKPNPWGLLGMHGDASEWCADWFAKDYFAASLGDDPSGPRDGTERVNRGGIWSAHALACRSASRRHYVPTFADCSTGFRVACSAEQPPAVKTPGAAPPLAVAPFDAAKARQYQEAWAKHLGVPAEVANSLGTKFVLIPPGEFEMGSSRAEFDEFVAREKQHEGGFWVKAYASEYPQHRVRITRAFYLSSCEVTQNEYEKLTGANPSHFKDAGGQMPVDTVAWDDAQRFCESLSALPPEQAAGRRYRLPREAEWEYACRAGTTTAYCFGDAPNTLGEYAWYLENSKRQTHPVGQKKANAWGLYDMHGNLNEWCADWCDDNYYAVSAPDDPMGPAIGTSRVLRGAHYANIPHQVRSAVRVRASPRERTDSRGFRVVMTLAAGPSPVPPAGRENAKGAGPPAGSTEAKRESTEERQAPPQSASENRSTPLSMQALVTDPPRIVGVRSWTLETIGHRRGVGDVAYSPDGRWLASGGHDGTLRIWNSTSGKLVRALVRNSMPITSVAWSPDGKFIASGGQWEYTTWIWEASTGRLVRSLAMKTNSYVPALAWSPDGRWLGAGGYAMVQLWSVEDAQPNETPVILKGHNAEVLSLAWSPDGKWLASGAFDKTAILWDFEKRKAAKAISPPANANGACRLAWSPNGRLLCVHYCPGPAVVWDVETWREVRTLPKSGYLCVAWLLDGKRLTASSTAPDAVTLWQLQTGQALWKTSNVREVKSLSVAKSGKLLAGAGADSVDVWHLDSSRHIKALPSHSAFEHWSDNPVALSQDGKGMATVHVERKEITLRIWQTDAGSIEREIPLEHFVQNAAWSPNQAALAVGQQMDASTLWNPQSGALIGKFPRTFFFGGPMAWSPDGKGLAVAQEKEGYIWDGRQKRCKLPGGTRGIAFSPDGRSVAVVVGQEIRLCDASSGEPRGTLAGLAGESLFGVAWSPDGKAVASAAGEHLLRVWDIPSRQLVGKWDVPVEHNLRSVRWIGPETIAAAGLDGGCVWDTKQGKLLRKFAGHAGFNGSLSMTDELIAFPGPSLVRLRRIADGQLWKTILSLRNRQYAAVSADGHFRGSPGVEKEFVYVVETDTGQETLTPEQFAETYGWKNLPTKVP